MQEQKNKNPNVIMKILMGYQMNNCLLKHVVKTLQVFPQAIGLDGDIQLGTTHPSLTASWSGLYFVSPDAGHTE